MAFGLAVGLGGGLSGGLWRGLAFGLSVALALGLGSGIGLALTSRRVDGQPIGVEPTEEVRWSWAALRAGLPRWLSIGLAVAIVMGVLFGSAVDPGSGLVFAGLSGLTIALVIGPLVGLTAGLRDERVMPNEGIRRSAQHAIVVGLAAGVGAALTAGLGFACSSEERARCPPAWALAWPWGQPPRSGSARRHVCSITSSGHGWSAHGALPGSTVGSWRQ